MSRATQGDQCRSCGEARTMDQFVIIRENPDEGRVHISTCIDCIKKHNGLEDK